MENRLIALIVIVVLSFIAGYLIGRIHQDQKMMNYGNRNTRL